MKKILSILFLINSLIAFGQDLTIANNSEHTTTVTISYTSLTLGNNSQLNVVYDHTLTINGDATSNNGLGIFIDTDGTLIITGMLIGNNNIELNILGTLIVGGISIANNGTLTISGSGILIVEGDFTTGSGTIITIDGAMSVDGDISVGSGSTITNNGTISYTGNYEGPSIDNSGGGTVNPALPVTYLRINSICNNNGFVELVWVTATESNSSHFEVLRSRDGFNWEHIETIPAAGNSSSTNYYSYYDIGAGRYFEGYYRLKQVDFDGEFEYSYIISTFCKNMDIEIYPNPTKGEVSLGIRNNIQEMVTVSVMDYAGRILQEMIIKVDEGYKTIDLSTHINGIYIISISTSQNTYIHKIIKK
jgi:hypothetical protein